jgi:hypothetical protein
MEQVLESKRTIFHEKKPQQELNKFEIFMEKILSNDILYCFTAICYYNLLPFTSQISNIITS